MQEDVTDEISRQEIKKEFQLERMVLFSDAVFAIVITLMAIEIRVPEGSKIDIHSMPNIMLHLLPTIFAYCVSFIFIGAIWYNHLKMFSLLKDYDKGLVVRNLGLLFLIGLFPFSASLITRAKGDMIAFFLYIGIILLCMIAQFILYYYILITRPALRVHTDLEEHYQELRKRRIGLIGMVVSIVLVSVTYFMVKDPQMRPLSVLWIALFPLVYKIIIKKKKKGLQPA